MKGKIVLIPFPFTDLSASKLRPALVIHEGLSDVIVAFITTRHNPSGVLIESSTPEFKQSGLQATSTVRLDKIATVKKTMILGEIGELGEKNRNKVNNRLSEIFRI